MNKESKRMQRRMQPPVRAFVGSRRVVSSKTHSPPKPFQEVVILCYQLGLFVGQCFHVHVHPNIKAYEHGPRQESASRQGNPSLGNPSLVSAGTLHGPSFPLASNSSGPILWRNVSGRQCRWLVVDELGTPHYPVVDILGFPATPKKGSRKEPAQGVANSH